MKWCADDKIIICVIIKIAAGQTGSEPGFRRTDAINNKLSCPEITTGAINDPHCTLIRQAAVTESCAYCNIIEIITIKSADAAYIVTELITSIFSQESIIPSCSCATTAEKQVTCTAIHVAGVLKRSADNNIGDSIVVEITRVSDTNSEIVIDRFAQKIDYRNLGNTWR